MRLHQPLSAAIPISGSTPLPCTGALTADILITGCSAGGSVCGGIHNCCTGAASVPNVVSNRCLSHPMVTGSAVGLRILHPAVPIFIIAPLRHQLMLISILVGVVFLSLLLLYPLFSRADPMGARSGKHPFDESRRNKQQVWCLHLHLCILSFWYEHHAPVVFIAEKGS